MSPSVSRQASAYWTLPVRRNLQQQSPFLMPCSAFLYEQLQGWANHAVCLRTLLYALVTQAQQYSPCHWLLSSDIQGH